MVCVLRTLKNKQNVSNIDSFIGCCSQRPGVLRGQTTTISVWFFSYSLVCRLHSYLEKLLFQKPACHIALLGLITLVLFVQLFLHFQITTLL